MGANVDELAKIYELPLEDGHEHASLDKVAADLVACDESLRIVAGAPALEGQAQTAFDQALAQVQAEVRKWHNALAQIKAAHESARDAMRQTKVSYEEITSASPQAPGSAPEAAEVEVVREQQAAEALAPMDTALVSAKDTLRAVDTTRPAFDPNRRVNPLPMVSSAAVTGGMVAVAGGSSHGAAGGAGATAASGGAGSGGAAATVGAAVSDPSNALFFPGAVAAAQARAAGGTGGSGAIAGTRTASSPLISNGVLRNPAYDSFRTLPSSSRMTADGSVQGTRRLTAREIASSVPPSSQVPYPEAGRAGAGGVSGPGAVAGAAGGMAAAGVVSGAGAVSGAGMTGVSAAGAAGAQGLGISGTTSQAAAAQAAGASQASSGAGAGAQGAGMRGAAPGAGGGVQGGSGQRQRKRLRGTYVVDMITLPEEAVPGDPGPAGEAGSRETLTPMALPDEDDRW